VLAAVGVLALLTIMPGPDMAVMTRVGLAAGRATASRTALGIVSGLAVWGLLTAAGLAAILAASARAYTVVKVAGAIYLVFLGVQTLVRRRRRAVIDDDGDAAREQSATGGFRTGLASNLLNPKIAVFYTSVLPQLVPDDAPTTPTLVLLVVVHIVISLVWLNVYAAALESARMLLQRPAVRRTLDLVTGAILVAFGVRVAVAE